MEHTQTNYPVAEILRDETTINTEYEEAFKIFTQDGHVLYLGEKTFYRMVEHSQREEDQFTLFDTCIQDTKVDITVVMDNHAYYIDMKYIETNITHSFSLRMPDLYLYAMIKDQEKAVNDLLVDRVLRSFIKSTEEV